MPRIEINNFHTDSKYSGGAQPWVYAKISTKYEYKIVTYNSNKASRGLKL